MVIYMSPLGRWFAVAPTSSAGSVLRIGLQLLWRGVCIIVHSVVALKASNTTVRVRFTTDTAYLQDLRHIVIALSMEMSFHVLLGNRSTPTPIFISNKGIVGGHRTPT